MQLLFTYIDPWEECKIWSVTEVNLLTRVRITHHSSDLLLRHFHQCNNFSRRKYFCICTYRHQVEMRILFVSLVSGDKSTQPRQAKINCCRQKRVFDMVTTCDTWYSEKTSSWQDCCRVYLTLHVVLCVVIVIGIATLLHNIFNN